MLLPGSGLDRSDDLPGDTELGKSAKRGKFVPPKIADGLVQTDHPLLNDILAIGTDKEIRSGLGFHKILIFQNQEFQGNIVATFSLADNILIAFKL